MARSSLPLLAAALTTALVTACGPNAATPPQSAATSNSTTASADPPEPTTGSATPPATGTADCVDGPLTITHRPGDDRARSACARAGGDVIITLHTASGYRWEQLESSDPGIATVVESHVDPDGTAHALVHAERPGTAAITTSDTYTPDRFGPPTLLWKLRLQVH